MINKNALSLALIHFLIGILGYLILFNLGVINILPDNLNLLHWDAKWFNSIRQQGYMFVPNQMNNLAFFPLFPFLWKFSTLDPLWISIANGALFIISFSILIDRRNVSTSISLFLLSVASNIFFFLPYSESLFFLFSTLLLVGLETKNTYLRIIGYFGASLARSSSLIFVISILVCSFVGRSKTFKDHISYLTDLSSAILGLLVGSWIQYHQTGKWFYFIDVQKFWGRDWHIPGFPLTSTFPERTLGVDGIAFIIGLIAIFFVVKWFGTYLSSLYKGGSAYFRMDNSVAFSALYISGITILDTCYTIKLDNSSNIWSINRHIFCTPYFIVFLIWLYRYKIKSKTEIYFLCLIIAGGIYFTGIYIYPNHVLNYLIFFLSFVIIRYFPSLVPYVIPIYLFNIINQVLFYEDFLKNLWMG